VAPLALETQAAPLALKCLASTATTAGLATISQAEAVAASNTATSADEVSLVHLGLRLKVRLHLEDGGVSGRPMHTCARSECGCLGVFYTCFGGGSAEVCASVGLEQDDEEAVGDVDRVRALFARSAPALSLVHNGCGQSGVSSSKVALKVHRTEFDAAAGEWRLYFRPSKNTGSCLAQAKVQWGRFNSVSSGGFEVRTKPHKWVLVQDMPASWREGDVRAWLSDFDHSSAASAVVSIVQPATSDRLPHAFVQLKDRSEAHEIMKGFRARSGWTIGGSTPLVSFLAGLSRAVSEDPTYSSVPVPPPALSCPAFVQLDHVSHFTSGPSSSSSAAAAAAEAETETPSVRAPKRTRHSDEDDEVDFEPASAAKRPKQLYPSTSTPSMHSEDDELYASSSSPLSEGDRFLHELEVAQPIIRPVSIPQWKIDGHRFMPAASVSAIAQSFPALPDLDDSFSLVMPRAKPFAEASYDSLESLSSFT